MQQFHGDLPTGYHTGNICFGSIQQELQGSWQQFSSILQFAVRTLYVNLDELMTSTMLKAAQLTS